MQDMDRLLKEALSSHTFWEEACDIVCVAADPYWRDYYGSRASDSMAVSDLSETAW